mgnify:CR=1 FL=1
MVPLVPNGLFPKRVPDIPPVCLTLIPPSLVTSILSPIVSGDCTIETVALLFALPPVPVHAILYVVFDVGLTVAVPDVPLLPLHPPLAVHAVTLALDHVRVAGLPDSTVVGEAEMETEGALGSTPSATAS